MKSNPENKEKDLISLGEFRVKLKKLKEKLVKAQGREGHLAAIQVSDAWYDAYKELNQARRNLIVFCVKHIREAQGSTQAIKLLDLAEVAMMDNTGELNTTIADILVAMAFCPELDDPDYEFAPDFNTINTETAKEIAAAIGRQTAEFMASKDGDKLAN